jgi:predicted site-specific integrase-resolvase
MTADEPGDPEPEALVTGREAAQVVGVSPKTVQRWIRLGLLSPEPHAHGRRVSVAAVRTLAASVHQPHPGAEHRELPDDDAEYLPISVAARVAGVGVTTVHTWARTGQVASRPHFHGRLVSLAAVRAEVEARRAPWAACGPAALRAAPADDAAEYVLPSLAARQVGVPAWQVHNWLRQGKVAWRPSPQGRLVRLADVQALAAQVRAGRRPPAPVSSDT